MMRLYNCCLVKSHPLLQVLRLKGNSDLAAVPDLVSLDSLEKLYVDDVLAASLPAGLRKLTQ
jgi:hypothetical protein